MFFFLTKALKLDFKKEKNADVTLCQISAPPLEWDVLFKWLLNENEALFKEKIVIVLRFKHVKLSR